MNTVARNLFFLALFKSFVLLLVMPVGFGADGASYLGYIDAVNNPQNPDLLWLIRGATPIYPFFTYAFYWVGLKTGFAIVGAQIILGALVAPAIYMVLKPHHPRGALWAGILLALDPQSGYLQQLVATEGLYIPMLGLGLAAFLWAAYNDIPLWQIFAVGFFIGIGALARPIGLFLIVPFAFFFVLMKKSLNSTAVLTLGYVALIIFVSLFNAVQFDFFAPSNNGGFYLATRLFGVGGLYDEENGDASKELFMLAQDCDIALSNAADVNLDITQNLRLCLYYTHELSLNEISSLYQDVYAESTNANPISFLQTMIEQLLTYISFTSDPYDLESAKDTINDCNLYNPENPYAWYDGLQIFCPHPPTPLNFAAPILFIGLLGFSIFTRFVNFVAAGVLSKRFGSTTRQILLLVFALYSYHAVVTAFAGTILARYVTVTNPYTLITIGIVSAEIYILWQTRFGSPDNED